MRSSNGRGMRVERVGRGDEEVLRQVERQVQVVVAKLEVLRRIENFQQRRGGIAAKVPSQLVDLVEHQQWIPHAGAANRLDDPPGHGADIGAAMAAQLRLVVHAAQAHPLELAAHGPGNRLAERRLADARRPDETEDRGLGAGVELHHGQLLDDPLLDLLEIVVIFVQNLPGPGEVENVLGRLVPGEIQNSSR